MITPALLVFVDGRLVARVAAPADFAPRAWLLGVVAVQATFEDRCASAIVRAHITGQAAPTVEPLAPGGVAHVALAYPGYEPELPRVAPPALGDDAGRLAVFVDGDFVMSVGCAASEPGPLRSFGHVFCRYTLGGGHEAGYDLTDFLPPAPGEKFERALSRALEVGSVVSYAFAAAHP